MADFLSYFVFRVLYFFFSKIFASNLRASKQMHLLMDISCKGVRSSWDFYQRKDFMYDLAKRMAPTTSGRRWDLCYQIKSIEIIYKSVLDCYTMANSTNVMYVCLLIWVLYTFPPTDSGCMNERRSEKVTGLERRQGMNFQAFINEQPSQYLPQNPIHNQL